MIKLGLKSVLKLPEKSVFHLMGLFIGALVISSPTYGQTDHSLQQAPIQAPTFQAPIQAPASQVQNAFSDPQNVPADLARIDQAMNNTVSFSGRFTQYTSDGSSADGAIYIRRPGKLRFEYESPNPLLIVSDGTTMTQHDPILETTDRVPLASTPLHFFLKENVQLERDTEVIGLIKTPTQISVTAQDGTGQIDGRITMIFEPNTLALKEWIIADDFGQQTRVILSDLRYNERINPRLFVLRDEPRRNRRR